MKLSAKKRRALSVALAFIIALGIAAFIMHPRAALGEVTLWYIEEDALGEGLEKLAEEYNSSLFRSGKAVELKAFADEKALAEAFEVNAPDLLLCSHYRAFDLASRGVLTDVSALLSAAPDYPQAVLSRGDSIGKSFFPIGCDVPVLLVSEERCPESGFESMDALAAAALDYTAETGEPYFSADSFSALFYTCLLREGEEFDAEDRKSEAYIKLYNLLAGCAYSGALSLSDNPADEVYAGKLACAEVFCSSLHSTDGFDVYPLPSLSGTDSSDSIGEAYGLAVTAREEERGKDAAAFISWLFSGGRGVKLAAGCSFVPAQESADIDGDALAPSLMELQGALISLPAPSSAFSENADGFEANFRARMAFLMD